MIALKSFGDLVMRHRGARICVMGGGPTLAEDIARVEADIWISVNQHGAALRKVDYVVAMDNLHTVQKVLMPKLIRPLTAAPIIGPWHWCDYGITNYPMAPRLLLSGVIAQWAACMMGAHPVILAGFGCYEGTSQEQRSINQHRDILPHVAECAVRVVSGPLTRFWPKYDPAEVLPPYVEPELFAGVMEHGVCVRVIKSVPIRGREYPPGTVLYVPRAEVHRQIKHRSLIEIDPPDRPSPPLVAAKKSLRKRAPSFQGALNVNC